MLNVRESREILGKASAELSDEEVIAIRDQVYALAGIFVDTLLDARAAVAKN